MVSEGPGKDDSPLDYSLLRTASERDFFKRPGLDVGKSKHNARGLLMAYS